MMDFTRAPANRDPQVPIHALTTKQRALVEAVDAFERVTGEPCSASALARRLRLHHSTVQEHLSALHRKGWLQTPNSPVSLRRKLR
jgi:DNA-binding IclR family transcriptional regulator